MDQLPVDWIELAGYAASCLVFLTFWMKTLIPLRIMAIVSNLFFILYALGADLMPVILLHSALLPLNIWRVIQHVMVYRRVRDTTLKMADVKGLIPFMRRQTFIAGTELFRKGDTADTIYYLSKGSVLLPEIGKTLPPGTLFGEIGLFTPDRARTASAQCTENSELLVISEDDIVGHCLNDPAFGLFLTKLVAGRMAENQENAAKR